MKLEWQNQSKKQILAMRLGCLFNTGATLQKKLKAMGETKATFCNEEKLERLAVCTITLREEFLLLLVILDLSSR